MSWLSEVEQALGRPAARVSFAAVLLGAVAFATGLAGGAAPRTFAALIASWLFFTGVATGAVAFRAFFRVIGADWSRQLSSVGGALASFLPVAAALLAVIVAGAGSAPWVAVPTGWLAPSSLALRELVLNGLLFALAWLGIRGTGEDGRGPTPRAAVLYLLSFAVVLSIWAFDFVLGPDPVFESTLVGVAMFVGAFLAGTGAVTLIALLCGLLTERQRTDARGLILALAIFWAYLFCSQYLTVWYGNLPDETAFALRRAVDGWLGITGLVLALVFAVPFLGLLAFPGVRRSARFLGAVVALQALGLWLSLHLLVVPSLAPLGSSPLTPRDLLIALGMLGAFALSVARPVGRLVASR